MNEKKIRGKDMERFYNIEKIKKKKSTGFDRI